VAAILLGIWLKARCNTARFLLKAEVQVSTVCLLLDMASIFQDTFSLAALELATGTSKTINFL